MSAGAIFALEALPGTLKTCFSAFSTWVHKVCWVPGLGVQVTFKALQGVPYFTCYYPGTTYADYELFLLAASRGVHVHEKYKTRPYVPVALEG
jgi:hypothetical protein